MPPEHPYGPSSTPVGPEQYDFIVNYDKQRHPNRLPGFNSTSLKNRLLVAGGGALLLIIVAWILIAFLTSSSGSPTAPLVTIAQQQNELARISLLADQTATAQPTKDFAATTNLSLQSEQQAFIGYLRSVGSAPSAAVLQASRSTKTDATLHAAQTSGTYDQTYISVAQSELSSYKQALQLAFAHTKNAKEQQLLSSAYTQAQMLLQQSSQTE